MGADEGNMKLCGAFAFGPLYDCVADMGMEGAWPWPEAEEKGMDGMVVFSMEAKALTRSNGRRGAWAWGWGADMC